MPRFMYVNGEIVKRKDAVHINVSCFSLGVGRVDAGLAL